MPRCGRPVRRAVSRPVCADEKNPALSLDRKLFGTSTVGPHTAQPAPAVAPHDPPRQADACRSAIGRPILCRLQVRISDTGEVTVSVSRPSDAGVHNAGRAITRTELDDGSWKLLYGFDSSKVLDRYGWNKNVSVDGSTSSLVMKPGPSDKGDYLSAGIAPKERFRVPVTVEIDVTPVDIASMLRLELMGGNVSAHGQHLFFLRSDDGFRKTAVVEASTGQGERGTTHLAETVRVDKPFEK